MLLHQIEGKFRNSVRNISLPNSCDVHSSEVPIVASLSPESNAELLLDLDNAGEVSSSLNSPLLFWGETNPGDLCGSLCGGVILWSLSTSLPCLSNIMLNLLNSFLFKLKTVNKPCYNDWLCLHDYTKVIGLKRKQHLFGAERLKWFLLFIGIDISGKC